MGINTPMVSFPIDVKDYKSKMELWLKSQTGCQATYSKLMEIKGKKQEVLDWLEYRGLSFLLKPDVIKTKYMWDCCLSISELLMNFDLFISEIEEMTDERMSVREFNLRHKMQEFDGKLGNL